MSWSSGWYSSLGNWYIYDGACLPLESNMLLQRKAMTMEKYVAEQCAMYIKNLSVTPKKKKKPKLSCCK